MPVPLPLLDTSAPVVPLAHLDELWFQVMGTLCNLACRHCFISCSPHNHAFGPLELPAIRRLLDESVAFGVKEYYFTGGEPFLHPEMTAILELSLRYGSTTVLTNGTVLKDEWLVRLAQAEARSLYSLEFRLSLDAPTAPRNDAIRGVGAFERALHGMRQLLAHGFLPIITVARTQEDEDDVALFADFVQLLRSNGYARPRIKILHTLRIGAEAERLRGYSADERVTPDMMHGFDEGQLLCNHSRIVTDRGVHVCPILIEAPTSLMGQTLAETLGGFPLRYQACYTCYHHGNLCANPSGKQHDG